MGLALLPVSVPTPSVGANTTSQSAVTEGTSPAATSASVLVTGGETARAEQNSDSNTKRNSSGGDDGQGGATADLARSIEAAPEFPAEPVDELELPVALIDLARFAQSTPVRSTEADSETSRAVQQRIMDESMTESLTPPAEVRAETDVATMRAASVESQAITWRQL